MTAEVATPEPFGTLHTDLLAVLDARPLAEAARLVSLVSGFGNTDRVGELLRGVCEDPEALARCAAESLPHPLGFDKFVLLARPEYQIQLHVWWPGRPSEREHVHNHRFGFSSTVVAGWLEVSEYEIAESGTLMNRFSERHEEENASFLFQAIDAVPVRCRAVTILGPGSAYFMSADVLHRIAVDSGDLVATLFVKLPPGRQTTTVLVDPSSGPPPPAERVQFTPDEVRHRLARFIAEIG